MWKRISSVLALICLVSSLAVFAGCSLEDAKKNTLSARKFTEKYGDLAPAGYRWIPAGLSGLLTLALGIIGITKERRKGKQMKNAIITKADQIDKLILSADAQKDNPGNVVTNFMKIDTRKRPIEEKKCLSEFDAIRKGYK